MPNFLVRSLHTSSSLLAKSIFLLVRANQRQNVYKSPKSYLQFLKHFFLIERTIEQKNNSKLSCEAHLERKNPNDQQIKKINSIDTYLFQVAGIFRWASLLYIEFGCASFTGLGAWYTGLGAW